MTLPPATILLVEDNQSLLDGIHDLLEVGDIGYELDIITAADGQAGFDAIVVHTPDLIVSDIMMPHMDGFQLLHAVRQNPEWLHIPVIFLTAKGKEQDVQEGRLSGAELYITKPFNSEELLELVKSQLDRTFALQEARERSLDRLKQGVMQILNHEFRTPLTYVTAYYEMLAVSLSSFDSNEDLEVYLRGIQAGCVRLSQLVDDLIAVVELRSGETQTRIGQRARPLDDVMAIFRQAGQARQQQAAEKGIELHIDAPDDAPAIFGDAAALRDIFDRLVDNAIKFTQGKTSSPKEVRLTVTIGDDEIDFAVQDTGIGFPEHVRETIFEPFIQFNRSVMEQQGSGSGLTIAKGLVDLHKGRLEAQSVVGQGSTFTVTLPIDREARPAKVVTGHKDDPPQATVLLVEDDIYLLEGLREILEIVDRDYSFRVFTAANGREGLELLSRVQPDLIVSDVMMPHMDGYEFLNEVRQNPDWVQIPVIFLTARGEKRERHRGLISGVAEYVAKPYDSDYLIDVIIAQLNRHFQVQGVVDQSFDELKRSILDLLQPDFRQPLITVADHSQKLVGNLHGAQTDADLKSSLRSIQNSSKHLTRLVEDFITLAEIKTGQTAASFQRTAQPLFDPGLILMDTMQARQTAVHQAGAQLLYNYQRGVTPILCTSHLLSDSLSRLVDIALAASNDEPGGDIALELEETETAVTFHVHRHAPLPRAAAAGLEQLFAEGEQTLADQPEIAPNAAIAKELIGLHGGRVQFQHDERGFDFAVRLPAYRSG